MDTRKDKTVVKSCKEQLVNRSMDRTRLFCDIKHILPVTQALRVHIDRLIRNRSWYPKMVIETWLSSYNEEL